MNDSVGGNILQKEMKKAGFLPGHHMWTVKHASAGGEQKFLATHWTGR
jgi:hypothetical protein